MRRLNEKETWEFLQANWMTHDALWYREVASRFQMAEASPMNLRVCKSLGRIELRRLLKATQSDPPRDMGGLKAIYEEARRLLVPPFFEGEAEFQGEDTVVFRTRECFAHKGMTQAGLIHEYACGIFERIGGWFDAMEIEYRRRPDLSRCLKHMGRECHVTFSLRFK